MKLQKLFYGLFHIQGKRFCLRLVLLLTAAAVAAGAIACAVRLSAHRLPGVNGSAGKSSSFVVSSNVPSAVSSSSSGSAVPSSPQSGKAGRDYSYFDDAVFMGDSLTEDILSYDVMDKAAVVASIGASTYTALHNRQIAINGNKTDLAWMPERAAASHPKKIYLLFGLNDLCWGSEMSKSQFLQYYAALIGAVRSECPGAKIFIQSILPISASAENSRDFPFDNAKIDDYNIAIQGMCAQEGLTYLDVASVLRGPDGKLPANATDDGAHLRSREYTLWFGYLLSNG